MGSVCCIAAREVSLPNGSRGENVYRNAMYSPSWNFQWDSRRRVASEVENYSYAPSHDISRESSMELKRELGIHKGRFSGGGSSLDNSGSPVSQKFLIHEGLAAHPVTPSDSLMAGNGSIEAQSSIDFSENIDTTGPKLSLPLPSSSSFLIHSPGNRLLTGLKSPVSEGTPSIMTGSKCGSSDGWSMRAFSELVAASSQKERERLSFESEFLGSGGRGHGSKMSSSEVSNNNNNRLSFSSSRSSVSAADILQTCCACSKLLAERCSVELPVTAVLVCGHVFHAECLESMVARDCNRYDPSCPMCLTREEKKKKQVAVVVSRRAKEIFKFRRSNNNKISRNRVVDSHVDGLNCGANVEFGGGVAKMVEGAGTSSGAWRSIAKPFLKIHWNKRSRTTTTGGMYENNGSSSSSMNKWDWERYQKH